MKEGIKIIWTIGHSIRTFEEFVAMLHSFKIEKLVDIRSFPAPVNFHNTIKKHCKFLCPKTTLNM